MKRLIDFLDSHDITVVSHTDDAIVVIDNFQTPDGVWHSEQATIAATRDAVEAFLGY